MPEVSSLLNRIWSAYNRAGIADDFTIILRITELLLSDQKPNIPEVLRFAESDTTNGEVQPARFVADLEEAAEEAGDKAQLLDHYVLFRLADKLPGVRFPTPRHIVASMQRLAQIGPEDVLVDFACGSGGLLVSHTEGSKRPKEIFGIDIAPEWAALAWANTTLHHEANADIIVGNALRVCGPGGKLSGKQFDRILMAPPFGLQIDPGLAKQTIGRDVGSSSEVVLTALALSRLAKGGRAAILVPSGLLYRNHASEKWLRKQLVEFYNLEAIVTLPKDALQPFSALPTHLLLVSSSPVSRQDQTWFFQTEFDGYPIGRNRDLTELPGKQNDLRFMEEVILTQSRPFDLEFSPDESAIIGIRKLRAENQLSGVTIQALPNVRISSVKRLSDKSDPSTTFLLAEVIDTATLNTIQVHITVDEDLMIYEEKREQKDLNNQYNFWPLFEGNEDGQAIAIHKGNRLLGVTASANAQIAKSYNLRPDQYMQTGEIQQTITSPASIIEHIRRTQIRFTENLDRLALRARLTDISLQTRSTKTQEEIKPFVGLSTTQQRIWERILAYTKDEATESFSLQKLAQDPALPINGKELAQTLELFMCMGIIIPVTKVDQKTLQVEEVEYYTRVTTQDNWKWDS
jgi:type I restriction enzyme M protein